MAEVLAAASESAPGECPPGSEDARRLAKALNETLVGASNARLASLGLDESLGPPVGPPPNWQERESDGGILAGVGCLVGIGVGLAALALRGALALWQDLGSLLP